MYKLFNAIHLLILTFTLSACVSGSGTGGGDDILLSVFPDPEYSDYTSVNNLKIVGYWNVNGEITLKCHNHEGELIDLLYAGTNSYSYKLIPRDSQQVMDAIKEDCKKYNDIQGDHYKFYIMLADIYLPILTNSQQKCIYTKILDRADTMDSVLSCLDGDKRDGLETVTQNHEIKEINKLKVYVEAGAASSDSNKALREVYTKSENTEGSN